MLALFAILLLTIYLFVIDLTIYHIVFNYYAGRV